MTFLTSILLSGPPGDRFLPVRPRIWRFLTTFACLAPGEINERHNRPGYSVFLPLFPFLRVCGTSFPRLCTFLFCRVLHIFEIPRVFSLFAEFRFFVGFVLFDQFWCFFNFSSFSKSCAHLLTFSEFDQKDDRFSTFFRLQEAEKSSIFCHFYEKTGLRPLRRRPRCGYEVEVTLCVRRNESQVRQS
jgi:hypothetical protein